MPRARAGWRANVVAAVVLVAVGVSWASVVQTPTFEASAQVLVGWQQEGRLETSELEPLMQTMAHVTDSRPVAEETIRRLELEMTPTELFDKLTVEQVENTRFMDLTYESTDPVKATKIVNTVGEVASELISARSARSPGSQLTANVYEEAIVPESPVSPKPLRNGLLTLVIGLVLAVSRPLLWLRGAGNLTLRAVRRARLSGGNHDGQAVVIKEKELLRVLDHRGKLTAFEAALETSLTAAEAERMLQDLADKGHLKVSLEHGRLVYALWEPDAPL